MEFKMDKLCDRILILVDNPEDYLRPSNKLEKWVKKTRCLYNFTKKEEEKYCLPSSENALSHLRTDGLDTEQIWQLLELQNKRLLAAPEDLKGLDDINLCFSVAKLSSLAKYDKLVEEESKNEDTDKFKDGDSLLSKSSDESEEVEDAEEDDEDEGMGSLENLEDDSDDISDSELFNDTADIDAGLNLVFSDDSDKEEDNFNEFIATEGVEDSDDDENSSSKFLKQLKSSNEVQKKQNEESSDEEEEYKDDNRIPNMGKHSKFRQFKSTEVDSKFFRLRESEWIADQDIIGDNFDMEADDDIDLMQDISDGEEEEGGVMYKAFFDGDEETKHKKKSKANKDENVAINDDEDFEPDDDDDNNEDTENQMKVDDDEDEDSKEVTQLLGLTKTEEKSTFEMERERELMLMSTLEEDNITEKPWFLKGEIASTERPENSTLEEQLEYNVAARQRPVITEDTTSLVEKIILNRIRSKAWDDVERIVKPNLDPYEYKKKLLLDQDKSKKSLAEIYEEEYLMQQKKDTGNKEEEEFPEHTEIREKIDEIFSLLDALSNYHYTPKMATAEVKIQSNLPAVTMEEATPITATDATLLAPQEILAPVRGELRGKTELTLTDRKRERRRKKSIQKKKAKVQEKKLQENLKKSSGGKKLDTKTTMNLVRKAVKAGQVKVLDGQQHKVLKSSQSFFKQLQENTKINPREKKLDKRKKNSDKQSASKLLL